MMLRPGCRDVPAQGLTPPLHPRKGFHPLTRFRWRDPVELSECAVSIADAGIRSETHAFYFSLCFVLRWAAAQTCAGANAAPATEARGFTP